MRSGERSPPRVEASTAVNRARGSEGGCAMTTPLPSYRGGAAVTTKYDVPQLHPLPLQTLQQWTDGCMSYLV